jgi:Flp pilus assembly protein CpaB
MELLRRIDRWFTKPMVAALAVLALGCTVTYYRARIDRMDIPGKAVVVVAARDIRPGEEIRGTDVREKEIYIPDMHGSSLRDMAEAIGKVALNAIPEGRVILERELTGREGWYREDEREIGIKLKDCTDAVAGDIRPGDVVDIMVSYTPEAGDLQPEVLAEGVRLEKVFNERNIEYREYRGKDAFIPHHVLVRLSYEQEKRLDAGLKKGRVYLRRYGNYVRIGEGRTGAEEDRVIITGGDQSEEY